MAKLYRFGVHTFYRPRAWGDGSHGPVWSALQVQAKSATDGAPKP
jgi:hypothetical protein